MSWFKVDDNFHSHPKVKSIPRKDRATALGLWVQAGSWAAQQLTDGFVPDYMIEEFGVAEKIATALGTAALWVRSPENDGWNFKDWTDHQPSRVEVQAKRKASAERVRLYRERKNGSSNAPVTHYEDVRDADVTPPHVTTPRPDPTRPDPTVVPTELPNTSPPTVGKRRSQKTASPAIRLPAEWQPTLDLIAWVKAECPAVNGRAETENFKDWWAAANGPQSVKRDWNAAFRTWMRRSQKDATEQGTRRSARQDIPRPNAATQRTNDSVALIRQLEAQGTGQQLALGGN